MLSRLSTFRSIASILSLADFSGEAGTITCSDQTRHDWTGASLETIFFERNSQHFERFAEGEGSIILALPQMFLQIFGMEQWNCSFFLLSLDEHGISGQWLGKNEAESYRDKWAAPQTRELSLDDL
jgi:hypothetical protein